MIQPMKSLGFLTTHPYSHLSCHSSPLTDTYSELLLNAVQLPFPWTSVILSRPYSCHFYSLNNPGFHRAAVAHYSSIFPTLFILHY